MVIQSSRDIATAQLERRRFMTMLGGSGESLKLLVHTRYERSEVLVSWGLFETRDELEAAFEQAVSSAGDAFPDNATLLVLLPEAQLPGE
jgi:hypothetical protein